MTKPVATGRDVLTREAFETLVGDWTLGGAAATLTQVQPGDPGASGRF